MAFALAKALGLQDVSWIVFSAVFVVQSSIGGTIHSALWRMAGGGAGLLLGLIASLLFGGGEWSTFGALIVGVAAMAAISATRPGLTYGLVTVTMLVLAPGVEVVEGALMKAAEIALGTLCGAAAASAVMPRAAHKQVDGHLADALRAIATFIGRDPGHVLGGPQEENGQARDMAETHLAQARDKLRQSRSRPRRTSEPVPARDDLRREIQRFWYSVLLLDQLVAPAAQLDLPEPITDPIACLTRECSSRLRRMGDGLTSSHSPDAWEPPATALKSLDDWSEQLPVHGRPADEIQHLYAVTFACKQLVEGVKRIDKKIQAFQMPQGKDQ